MIAPKPLRPALIIMEFMALAAGLGGQQPAPLRSEGAPDATIRDRVWGKR